MRLVVFRNSCVGFSWTSACRIPRWFWQASWIRTQAIAPLNCLGFKWQFIQCLHKTQVGQNNHKISQIRCSKGLVLLTSAKAAYFLWHVYATVIETSLTAKILEGKVLFKNIYKHRQRRINLVQEVNPTLPDEYVYEIPLCQRRNHSVLLGQCPKSDLDTYLHGVHEFLWNYTVFF